MNKKEYKAPKMKAVDFKNKTCLLCNSCSDVTTANHTILSLNIDNIDDYMA